MIDQILGWIATTIFTSIYAPVIGKHYERLLLVSFIGNCVAICYATLIGQRPLQVKYGIALICISLASYFFVYKKKKVL